ncbi:MAG: CvpA family protein [Lachnospiraceae bacterium]|jgi:hypothetical protein|nr:CvpA family protein [Lachnospiraceae bacterium]
MEKTGKLKQNFYSLILTALVGFIYFYINLPAINIHSDDFYGFIMLLCLIYTGCMIFLGGAKTRSVKEFITFSWKQVKLPFIVFVAIVVVTAVGYLFGLVIFRASAYSSLMPITTGDFTEDVAEISMDQIPMLDEASANTLANRKLGELSDLVSQFVVSDSSAQINYKARPVRVTYLHYESFFKWWSNRSEGIPAYMIVDMVTQDVNVVRLEEGIKYSPSEYFNRDLYRYLRFHYPTAIFENVNFEIDEEGVPYWVASVVEKRIGLFNGDDVQGVVLLNAVTGESVYHDVEDVPTWVDRVYSAELVVNQYNYYGRYHNGFFNSLFTQSDCTMATTGYNYIAMNDDVYLYTGITSISGDRGNIGFILVNQRTKDARYYSCAGAEEYSAMSSAEGAVQQFSYDATFPLLLNISDQPTYFMALKDAAGLVKMYAMVNVQQYQIVATGNSVRQCQQNYHDLLIDNQVIEDDGTYGGANAAASPEGVSGQGAGAEAENTAESPEEEPGIEEYEKISGTAGEIRTAVVDNNTCYFIQLSEPDSERYFMLRADENLEAVLLNEGDQVELYYLPDDGTERIVKAKLGKVTRTVKAQEASGEQEVSEP